MPGRLPKPWKQHQTEGTLRPDRHKKPPEPSGSPVQPKWLDKESRAWWRRVVPELVRIGLATSIDADALAGAARWYSIWRAADAKIRAGDGDAYKRSIEASVAWKAYSNVTARFGLSPVDRQKLAGTAPTNDEENPLVQLAKVQ